MDMQKLEMILEAASAAGDSAVHLALAYFGVSFLKVVLVLVFLGYVVRTGATLIRKAMQDSGSLAQLRDDMGVGTPGPVSSYEFGEMRQFVREAKKREDTRGRTDEY